MASEDDRLPRFNRYCIPYTLVCFSSGRWWPIFPFSEFPDATGEGIWKFVADVQAYEARQARPSASDARPLSRWASVPVIRS